MSKIKRVVAREILNSKGIPTVEVTVGLDNGIWATSSCPTGTSVSKYEAKEIRDSDRSRYVGLGVQSVVNNVNTIISPKLIGLEPQKQNEIDKLMIELDGTADKEKLGVNSILPVSMAVAKTAAKDLNLPLFKYLRRFLSLDGGKFKIPTTAYNVINGGKHAGNNLDFQEFFVIPASSIDYPQSLNMAVNIYQTLKRIIHDKGMGTLVGDEGGFGPILSTNRDALLILGEAINAFGYRPNYEVYLGVDAAANSFFDKGSYKIKDKEEPLSAKDLVGVYTNINREFNLLYLEDPMAEDDWEGWQMINAALTGNTLIVGDDLISTNPIRLQNAISKKAVGGIIIKPNQIGTIIETLAVVEMAQQSGLKIVVSHRSGDTNDDFIADFAVGVGADYVKFGAPSRGERTAKYNRLLEIHSLISSKQV